MTVDPREALCPYPGLEAFTAENRHYFFGRGRDTQLLISNLYASPLTVVYGSSGVGKTSVILAGVVPEVEREGDAVILVHRTWQDAARARSLGSRMAQAVARRMGEAAGDADGLRDTPLDVLAERLARRWRRPIFLVFDQFEEYFLHNEPSDAADSLDGELARLINRRDLDVNVMLVIREDSLAALDRFRHRIPTLLNNLYRLEHLTQGEARSAIEDPLAVLRQRPPADDLPVEMEEGLASTILDDLAALDPSAVTPGAAGDGRRVELPFLQVVLERIWLVECRSRSRVVRRKTFADAGGSRGIVRQRIAESLNALNVEEQGIVASVLRHLVTPSGAKIALTLNDLAGYAGVGPERVGAVIERLIGGGARVLRRVAHPTADPALTKYEIYHDALGAPLLAWRLEMDRRRDTVERQAKQRVQNWIVGLAVLAMAAVGIAAFLQRGKSRVESRELASIATGQLETDNRRAMLLALEAIKRSDNENAGEVVLRRALFEPGERLRDTTSRHLNRLTVSPGGRYVLGNDYLAGPILWTTDSLRRVPLPPDLKFVKAAAFDSAERRLLLVDERGPLVLDLDDGMKVTHLTPGNGNPIAGRLLRDGARAIVAYASEGVLEYRRTGATWTEVARGPRDAVPFADFHLSPNERWLAFVRPDGKANLIDRQPQPWRVLRLSLGEEQVSDVVFSSNGTLAVASNTKQVRVFSLETGEPVRVIPLSCAVTRIALARGEAAGTCTDGGFVQFNLPEMRSQARMGQEPPLVNRPGRFTDLALSADGRYVAGIGEGDLAPTVWSTFSRTEATRLRGHRSGVTALAFLPDSRHMITAGADSTIRKWEIVSASQRIGDGEFMGGRATAQLNDSVTRAGMVGPYGVQLWDLGRGAPFVEAPGQAWLPVIAVASEGDRVATLNGYAQVEEFSREEPTGSMVWDAPLRDSAVTRAEQGRLYHGSSLLQYVGRGDTLMLAANGPSGHGTDSSGIVLLARGNRRGVVLSRYSATIQSLSVDSSGRLAAVGLADGRVRVRGLRGDATEVELGKHSGGATAVAFGSGAVLASGGKLGDVFLFFPRHSSVPNADGAYGAAVKLGTHERGVVRLAFNKTGTVLASGDEGGTIRLWNTTGRRELCPLDGEHADFIRAIAFAPSGQTVATADERGVALWFIDVTSSSCRLGYRLADLESPTEAMRFTPNGSALVVVGRDGITRRYLKPVWAPRDSLIVWAAQRLRGRTLSEAERSRYVSSRLAIK